MSNNLTLGQLSKQLQIGDIIFTLINIYPFNKIAKDTNCWSNHVGIIIDITHEKITVAESIFPFSKMTKLSKHIKRSKNNYIAIYRIKNGFNLENHNLLKQSTQKRMKIFYDLGFDINSKRQFCSKMVHEILVESAHINIGKIETLKQLLENNKNSNIKFWKIWYRWNIPWQRQTITPASLMFDRKLDLIFEGSVI